ncbi:MAG: hypothetical protein R6U66_09475 [Bacteroidales bacterium]
MMKRISLLLLFLFSVGALYAQKDTQKPLKASFYGFVRTDFWYEDRASAEALEGLFSLFPLDRQLDAAGIDLNERSNTNLLGISTRVGTLIEGPEWLGAQTRMQIEGDFTGTSNTNSIRLRHANIQLVWENSQLLIGRFWHPMFLLQAFPTVMALNTGAPFNTFNRSPQLRFSHQLSSQLMVLGAAVYQSDYTSPGPEGKSGNYLRNAGTPELLLQLHWQRGSLSSGIGAEWKQIQPFIFTIGESGQTFSTNERLKTYAFQAYVKYKTQMFEWKMSTIQGQNLYEYTMLGGYAIKSIDPLTGNRKYTPYEQATYWTNIIYGDVFRVGMFGGYAVNKGTRDEITPSGGNIYARGENIEHMYRIAPWCAYSSNGFQLSAEYEYNYVAYGTIDIADKAQVKDTHGITSSRALLTLTYFF